MTQMFASPMPRNRSGRDEAWEIALAAGTPVLALAGEMPVDRLIAGDRVIARSGAVRLAACRAERVQDGDGPEARLIRLRFDRPVTMLTLAGDIAALPVQGDRRR